jgi:hypothetical protein
LVFVGVTAILASVCSNGAPPNTSQNANGLPAYWSANTNVNIYINSSDFSSTTDQGYIRTALSNWQKYITNVTYNVTVTTSPPVGQARSLVVQKGVLSPGKLGTNGYVQSGTAIQNSIITIDRSQVSGSLLLNVMVHELGHTYSLGDCTACSNTAMAYPITGSSPLLREGLAGISSMRSQPDRIPPQSCIFHQDGIAVR